MTTMTTGVRRTNWLILLMIVVGFGFVTFDFIELTFLTERTDKFFSWTIGSPLTAAVFGSFYFAASMITASAALNWKTWVRARPAVPGTFALVLLIELATLYNFEPFRLHLHAPDGITNFEFFLWIGAYTIEPIGLTIGMLMQRRMPGVDPPTVERLPAWWRNCAWVGGVGAIVVGALLFLLPYVAVDIWSWPLTRLLVPALGFAALGPLQLIAILRFTDEIDFGNLQIWGHLAFLVGVTILGFIGCVMAFRARRPGMSEAPPMPVAATTGTPPPAFTA